MHLDNFFGSKISVLGQLVHKFKLAAYRRWPLKLLYNGRLFNGMKISRRGFLSPVQIGRTCLSHLLTPKINSNASHKKICRNKWANAFARSAEYRNAHLASVGESGLLESRPYTLDASWMFWMIRVVTTRTVMLQHQRVVGQSWKHKKD